MSQTRKRRLSSGWTGHAVAGGTRLVLGGTVAAHCGRASRGVPFAGRPEPQSTEAVAVQPPSPGSAPRMLHGSEPVTDYARKAALASVNGGGRLVQGAAHIFNRVSH